MDKPICLALTIRHNIEPQPSDTFVSGQSWTCPRCGQEFSSPDVTIQDPDHCIFDKEIDGAQESPDGG